MNQILVIAWRGSDPPAQNASAAGESDRRPIVAGCACLLSAFALRDMVALCSGFTGLVFRALFPHSR